MEQDPFTPTLRPNVKHLARDLKRCFELKDFEALLLALKAEQNELLRKTLSSYPTFTTLTKSITL